MENASPRSPISGAPQNQGCGRGDESVGSSNYQILATKNGQVKLIPSTLLADTWADGPLFGFRNLAFASRMMLYEAESYRVSLSVECHPCEPTHPVGIMGQTMPAKLGPRMGLNVPTHVELWGGNTLICSTKSNEFGAFMLEGVPVGVYDLTIRFETEQITIAGFQVTNC